MKEIKILEKIWLSQELAHIYIALLKKWHLSIIDIAKSCKLSRPSVYKSLPELMSLWLVSEVTSGKRKKYSAESPDNLQNIFQKTQEDFAHVFESLKNTFQQEKTKPLLKSIEGENFNKLVYEDVVNTLWQWETYMRFSARTTQQWIEKYAYYRSQRDKKDIQRLIVTSEKNAQTKPKRLNHEVRIVPKNYDLFDDNIAKVIYKDKVAIIDYNTQTSFIIEDKKFARFEAKLFKLLFKYLKKV